MSDRIANPLGTGSPSGAAVLTVSLGLLRTPTRMATIAPGIVLLPAAGWLADRASGMLAPVWGAMG